MLGKVIAPHEPPIAVRAAVPLVSRVSARVARQFVRAGKPFPTVQPRAHKGAFSSVSPDVRLQMRRLVVELVAVPVLASEHFLV